MRMYFKVESMSTENVTIPLNAKMYTEEEYENLYVNEKVALESKLEWVIADLTNLKTLIESESRIRYDGVRGLTIITFPYDAILGTDELKFKLKYTTTDDLISTARSRTIDLIDKEITERQKALDNIEDYLTHWVSFDTDPQVEEEKKEPEEVDVTNVSAEKSLFDWSEDTDLNNSNPIEEVKQEETKEKEEEKEE